MEGNPNIRFLTLTTRTTLSDQHKATFKNINLATYQETTNLYKQRALTICLNSLERLAFLDDDEMNNYILYIDEVSSFLEFTHNETLKGNMKQIYYVLMKLIKHCSKIIVSDALINDNVIQLLRCRKEANQTLFINNSFQKYKNKIAYRVRDENKFVEKIYEEIADDKYFLFGSDSNDTATKIYNKCLSKYPDKKDKFLLITADTDVKIKKCFRRLQRQICFLQPQDHLRDRL